jgi:hypothetical protein
MSIHVSHARLARRFFAAACGVSAFTMSACLSIDESANNNRYGSINFRATGSAEGPFAATPTAVFFTGGQATLPNSSTSSDQCAQFPLTGEQIVPGNLVGGPALELRVGGQSYSMTESATVARIYTLPAPGVALYEAGDSARITVPGVAGGFPGSQIAVRLAEPVLLGPLTPIVVGEDFPISWTTNGDPRSGVIISMRYALGAAADEPDRQLLCTVRDNGAYTIPGGLLTEWATSNAAFRSVNVLRWRTNEVSVDERTKLHIVSTIDTTVVNFPEP